MSDFFYQNQGEGRLLVTVGVPIAGATCKIKYVKPSGVTGQWNATISDAVNGVIYYDIASNLILNEYGKWKGWAYVTFSSGNSAPGRPFILTIKREGVD